MTSAAHVLIFGAAAVAAVETVDTVTGIVSATGVSSFIQGGAILGGMAVAWRLMSKAQRDSIETYRRTAKVDASRLELERQRWDLERAALVAEREELIEEIAKLRRPGG